MNRLTILIGALRSRPLWRLRLGAGLLLALAVVGQLTRTEPRPARAADVGNPHGDLKVECATCHSPEGWTPARISPSFDHAQFGPRLEGAHESLKCASCHKSLLFKQTSTACADCHQDPHSGELGDKCARCHSTRSFSERSVMEKEHALTRLPLTGAHVTLDCESCHGASQDGHLDFNGLSSECASCHKSTWEATSSPITRRPTSAPTAPPATPPASGPARRTITTGPISR